MEFLYTPLGEEFHYNTSITFVFISVQFSWVAQLCLTLCNPMNCSTPGLPVNHQLPEFTETHAHQVGDAIQASHPLSSPESFFKCFFHNYFLRVHSVSSHLLDNVFCRAEDSNLNEVKLINLPFMNHIFGVVSKRSSLCTYWASLVAQW